MVANWLTMDCGGQFYMAAAGWCGTSLGTKALVRWAACQLLVG